MKEHPQLRLNLLNVDQNAGSVNLCPKLSVKETEILFFSFYQGQTNKHEEKFSHLILEKTILQKNYSTAIGVVFHIHVSAIYRYLGTFCKDEKIKLCDRPFVLGHWTN